MYHCPIQFYLIGEQRDLWEQIRSMPPLENFTHGFTESVRPEPELLARADVIFARLPDVGAAETLNALRAGKKPDAELILLAGQAQAETLMEDPADITDLWTLPMSPAGARFRFGKWQRDFKLARDLWQTGQFLDANMETTPNLVWFKGRDGLYKKVNSSFCKMTGLSREQLLGQTRAEIWNEKRDAASDAPEREVIREGKTRVSREEIQTREGWTLLTVYRSPLYDLDGSVMGTAGTGMNVTREIAFERELAEKSRALEMLFSTLDCGVLCHSVDGSRIISVNRAALRLLDYESQEEMQRAGFDAVAQSVIDKDRLRECINGLKRVGDSVNVEYRVRHRDGRTLHILGNVKLMEEGGVLYYQRFLLDITEKKLRDEERLAAKDEEIRYREQLFDVFSTFLSDNIDDVFILMNSSGTTVEFASPNIERVLGVSTADIMENASAIGHAEYISGYEVGNAALEALEPGMALESMETRRINLKTGEEKWYYESVYCVLVQGVKKIVVYISDRTRERMSRNALSQALEIAQVANKAKSVFLSSVSHDIRTPLNAITGFVTLLREDAGNRERVLEYTQRISAASRHLLGLISDVLDMNKIESGSTVLNISELNLAGLVDEINAIIRPQAKARKQSFEIRISSLTNEHLLGDRLRINQILINILSNAVKYTPPGGTVRMLVDELPQVDRSYSRIRFTISDNGQGMSEDYLKVIFDPFTREQSAIQNKIQGTGLGMAITKSLVDLMDGSISVSSRPGEGSVFVVELELRIQKRADDLEFWRNHKIRRILIVDEDAGICQDIARKMEGTGVDVLCANDAAQAAGMFPPGSGDERPCDLILLDWNMPGLDTSRIVGRAAGMNIPVLLFTAYDWADIRDRAMEAGIRSFLPKPFFMSNFKDAVHRMQAPEETPDNAGKSVVKGKRVLVVDDIDVNRMVLVKILNVLGAECDTAENGQEAVEKFEASPPGGYDLILMDVQMPVLNGHEATRAIRAGRRPDARTVPVIAMTANAFVEDIRAALDAGMDAHLAKPVVVKQLESTVREVLERRAAEA